MPTLAGGTHHYGHLFMQTNLSTSQGGDHTHRPKLDYFRRDLVNGWLANHKTLPSTFLEIKTYINQATTTLMGADKIKDIWTLKPSPTKLSTHCAIDMWDGGIYQVAESLALFMGLLEPDPTRPSQSGIPAHNNQWADTDDNTRAWFEVVLLDRVQNPTWFPLGGVRL